MLSFAVLLFAATPGFSQTLGPSARQLAKGDWRLLVFYQGIQSQDLEFSVAGSNGTCTAGPNNPNGVRFGCGQSGDVTTTGDGGAGFVKIIFQPYDIFQYYAAFGVGEYTLTVPSITVTNKMTGSSPGTIVMGGVKAVIVPNTDYSPAVALDVGLSHSRYTFDRLAPASAGVSGNISQVLTLMQIQVALEASYRFRIRTLDKQDKNLPLLNERFYLEPYGGVKVVRIQSDLKDNATGGHAGGHQDTTTPFLGLKIPILGQEGFFMESTFVNGYTYAAGLMIAF